MKKGQVLFLLVLLSIITFSAFQKKQVTPNMVVKDRLMQDLNEFKELVNNLTTSANQKASKEELIALHKKARNQYKKIEGYVSLLFPFYQKKILGGPVYGLKVDVVKIFRVDPEGLQVIEELLAEDKLDKTSIQVQLNKLKYTVTNLEKELSTYKLNNMQIFEASRIELVNLVTLGVSGFDSPAFLYSISETKTALSSIQEDLQIFYNNAEDKDLQKDIAKRFKISDKLLKSSFDDFDRFSFVKEVTEPLHAAILNLHKKSGYELYHEVSPNERAFNYLSEGLFQKDFLNPYYSQRGNQKGYEPNQDLVDLGKMLFFDPILSGNNERSCSSCHQPEKAFTDNSAKSLAFDFEGTVDRNSPTLINSTFQDNFFWDMRSEDLNNQIEHVVLSHKEFRTDFNEIVAKLNQSQEYIDLFGKSYSSFPRSQRINTGTVKDALEAYVRSLQALNSPFDKYIRGEETAPKEVITGFNLFMGKANCGTCHFAPIFNGTVPPHYNETEGEVLGVTATSEMKKIDEDEGRFAVYKKRYPEIIFMKGMFKTPTVRNTELTAPYMHNGAFKTLEEVVEFYDLGGGQGLSLEMPSQTLSADHLNFTEEEEEALIAFMKSLTDTSGLTSRPKKLPKFESSALNMRKIGGVY